MRSLAEIRFRVRQELANFYLLLRQPRFRGPAIGKLALPDAETVANALEGTQYAESVRDIADRILRHDFPVLGLAIQTGREISWRRDYVHEKESGLLYFRQIPYLDFDKVGDHKLVWELNRHQHLVLLAQAFLLTGNGEYLREISGELRSWFVQNPFQRGINWASALEVAFRALSWIWVYHLVGEQLDCELRASLVTGIYQHGLHLAENLSVYFSPNTHLLGEAVALFAIGSLFPAFPQSESWKERSRQIVMEQLSAQVKNDGSHFEQSSYYHVYAVDFFLLFYILAGRPPSVVSTLTKMADYLSWLLGPAREISFFGDDDGGRLFHPYGERGCFGRATLATCGEVLHRPDWAGTGYELSEQAVWWLGANSLAPASANPSGVSGCKVFKDCGAVFLEAGKFFLQMDCGPFGFGGGGHSHSDTLSFTLRYEGELALTDPGTFTYISDLAQRNWFRGSAAHNSVMIDCQHQAEPAGPFRWSGKPDVHLYRCEKLGDSWMVDASCEYRQLRHRRKLLLNSTRLLVLDEVEALTPESANMSHRCEQIWQLGPRANQLFLSTSAPEKRQESDFSPAYGAKQPSVSKIAVLEGRLPLVFAMALSSEGPISADVEIVSGNFPAEME